MTDLPEALRSTLSERFRIEPPQAVRRERSSDGTEKLLLRYADGARVETVFLIDGPRVTQCVSTQVGCPLGCLFCATGALGFVRSLEASEIVSEVEEFGPGDSPRPVSSRNVVLMGMGEPLLNYDAVLRAVKVLNHPDGLKVGARRITISTAGIPEGIRRLAAEPLQVRLAVSLNATTDEQRSRLMPVNRKHPLGELLSALRHYRTSSGRRPTLEYVLLGGVNDSDEDLARLTSIARETSAHVNLIEFNPPPGREPSAFKPPAKALATRWRKHLAAGGVQCAIRFRRGLDIAAGCGQLAGGGLAERTP
jgi:23S rRNA (adenine2503-C2)-methyltransferase